LCGLGSISRRGLVTFAGDELGETAFEPATDAVQGGLIYLSTYPGHGFIDVRSTDQAVGEVPESLN
jgi:hypothetical protein